MFFILFLSMFLTMPILATNNELQKVFSYIYNYNIWSNPESQSGDGSSLYATQTIREKLPEILQRLNIKTLLDAPCGDFNWMKKIDIENYVESYTGIDIVSKLIEKNNATYGSEKIKFLTLDITEDTLPKVDLILCRDFIQHLSLSKIYKALTNFKKSGSKYLLISNHMRTLYNKDINDGEFAERNLLLPPFDMQNPLLIIHEKSKGSSDDKYLLLWQLN